MLSQGLGFSVANAQAVPSVSLERITHRRYFDGQLELLRRFAELCRAHDVRLIIAVSPRRSDVYPFDEADFRQAIDQVNNIVPLWDFTVPEWVSESSRLWIDATHFTPQLASMMLRRVFGVTRPDTAEAIGEWRGR